MAKEPNKLFVNFLSIGLICHKYKSTFLFNSLMHKYFKSNYIGQKQENNTAVPPVFMFFPVIKSTASIETIRFKYAFKDWNYATATVYFTLGKIPLHTDVTSFYCLNKGRGIIFVNRAWLLEKVPTEKILKMAILLKVRDIESSKHKSDKFVFMLFYFPGINLINRSAYTYIH